MKTRTPSQTPSIAAITPDDARSQAIGGINGSSPMVPGMDQQNPQWARWFDMLKANNGGTMPGLSGSVGFATPEYGSTADPSSATFTPPPVGGDALTPYQPPSLRALQPPSRRGLR